MAHGSKDRDPPTLLLLLLLLPPPPREPRKADADDDDEEEEEEKDVVEGTEGRFLSPEGGGCEVEAEAEDGDDGEVERSCWLLTPW